jgi:hypothetical protein
MSANLAERQAITRDDIFLEAKERFTIAESYESKNRKNGLDALRFRYQEQWEKGVRQQRVVEERPCLTVNHTDANCTRVQNQLRQQRPRIKCQPMGGAASEDKAKVINSLIRHIQNLSNAETAYDEGVRSAQDIGWGYWEILGRYCDPMSFDQDLIIKSVDNPFTCYDDPMAHTPCGEERKWFLITGKISRNEYKRKYPKAPNKEWNRAAIGDDNYEWENRDHVRLCRYFRIYEVPDTLVLMNDGRTALRSELPSEDVQQQMGWLPWVDPRTGKEKTRPTVRAQVQRFVLGGMEVLEKTDLPGKYIPVVRCLGNQVNIEGEILRWGMVKNMMDPARMFNYWESAAAEMVALAPKAPWVAAEGQTDNYPEWNDANRRAYSKLIYTPTVEPTTGQLVPPPMRQPPTPVPEGQRNASQMALMNLVAMAGMPMENPIEQGRVVSGNKYMQRRQRERDLMHFQYSDNQALAVIWTGIILLDLIPYYYDTDRQQRLVGEDGTASMTRINAPSDSPDAQAQGGIYQIAKNLEDGSYDIVMDAGPDYRTAQEEGAEGMLGILDTPLGPKVAERGADLVIRNMPWTGASELADRMLPDTPEGMKKVMEGMPPQAKSLVMSLQQQVQQLQQVTQQQALELKYKSTIAAAQIESADAKSKRDDATKRLDIATKSETSRDVAEIHAATQLLNSQMESASEEGQADKLIAKGLD